MGYGDALRDEVHSDSITPLIGIFDMYSASLAANTMAGCSCRALVSRLPITGCPTLGSSPGRTWSASCSGCGLRSPQQHLLVDIDDGYVDPEVACHVVEHLERIGASGVIREDQKRPRRCGHVTGKQILP
jgi:PEP phosphonomutase and related enzymes